MKKQHIYTVQFCSAIKIKTVMLVGNGELCFLSFMEWRFETHTVERDHERGEVYSNEERQEREWNHENKENQQDGMRMRGERRHKTPKV